MHHVSESIHIEWRSLFVDFSFLLRQHRYERTTQLEQSVRSHHRTRNARRQGREKSVLFGAYAAR